MRLTSEQFCYDENYIKYRILEITPKKVVMVATGTSIMITVSKEDFDIQYWMETPGVQVCRE